MQWRFLHKTTPQSLEELEQVLLTNRGILDPEVFFNPKSPTEISLEDVGIDVEQVRVAKERILAAVKKKQKILVFGDYDADGICATAIMWEALHAIGADALPFIPHREKHGYGLSAAALAEIAQHPLPSLIITVDTGIVAMEPIKDLMKKGVDVIVTDHHQPETTLPEALAIVHTTKVCGSAVAWFLARELSEEAAKQSLDLVALATVSDLMPLKETNRSLVFHGLANLNATKRLGLQVLIKLADLTGKKIGASEIGYVLAPRINAMGRLSHGLDALRLLCTNNAQRAQELASIVDDTNADRQQLTDDLMQLARQQVQTQKKQSLIIAYSPDFHEGVVGLIAGKLAEWYAKPAIVISLRGDTAKASARSVPGVNITELIRTAREHLIDVGGHPMAAGFSFESVKLDTVMNELFAYALENIDTALLQKVLTVECLLPMKLISEALVESLQKLAPFGQGNPEPIFGIHNVHVAEIKRIGSEQQHLKLLLKDPETQTLLPVLAWKKGEAAENIEKDSQVSVAGILQINEWRDKRSVQMVLKDLTGTDQS